jgi:glycogen debranching enzyme
MNFIEVEDKYYILASSVLADQETVVLKEGDSFAVFNRHGDIHQLGIGSLGVYHNGMRFLSETELSINGHKPLLLSVHPREDNQMIVVDLTNPDLPMEDEEVILRGTIHISRTKFLWKGVYHEKITLQNFALEPVDVNIEITFDADFSDIFEARGTVRARKGRMNTPTQDNKQHTELSYTGLDGVTRKTIINFYPVPNSLNSSVAAYKLSLASKEKTDLELSFSFTEDKDPYQFVNFAEAQAEMNAHIKRIGDFCAEINTSNEQFNEWVNRSRSDLITMSTRTPYGLYPYAGIPWYSTAFGRDGIITAMECLWVEPELAKGVLMYLAATQAKDFNDFQDAEPGKIFHETRKGEMAELGEIPFKLYYGTIDATPLFISLAGAYLERTNDLATIKKIWPNIQMALYWIDHYGDIDGDGFVEYKTKSSKGLTNQGWKDSFDSIFYEEGELAKDPIALCEVQGYVYDAKVKASEIALQLGETEVAESLKKSARQLKEHFNKMFWSKSKQIYHLALDGDKKPCAVVSSNAAHCLFSGIATPERAILVASAMLNEDMFSGWGIRTISSGETRYNPMSYHNGSIWPHENAMIAYGFSRYKLMNETVKVVKAMYDASQQYDGRLPELYCGFDRVKGQPPISYPVACSPQAWSVGAVFLMLQACLGMKLNAAANTIKFCRPTLPSFLKEITITNLRFNDKLLILQIRRTMEGIEIQQLNREAEVAIEIDGNQVLEPVG